MPKLFNKALCWTDIHLGLKNNSQHHNEDCWEFTKWMVDYALRENCDTAIFLGDFHNNRNSVNVLTLNYSQRCLEHVAQNFKKIYMIPGNHDLYYRDQRSVHSFLWARNISGVEIFNDITIINDCAFVPWLLSDEHQKISKIEAKYAFGHLELPHFMMNSQVRMPDVGEIQQSHLSGVELVFSGHFHKRQRQNNIQYMGNCFPHNFSDVNDDNRGIMILEWGAEPQFVYWPDSPRYRVLNLSDVIQDPEKTLHPRSYVRINLDVALSYEEASMLKESFAKDYNLREITWLPPKNTELTENTSNTDIKFQSVDSIVANEITTIQSEVYDPSLLLNIFQHL